jgi:hypothetical protein
MTAYKNAFPDPYFKHSEKCDVLATLKMLLILLVYE